MSDNKGYEFNDQENAVIASAATWAKVIAAITFLSAMGNLCGGKWVNGGVGIMVGALFMAVAQAFQQIVATQGDDIGHLMLALDKLGTILIIRIIGTVLAVGVGIVMMVLVANSSA